MTVLADYYRSKIAEGAATAAATAENARTQSMAQQDNSATQVAQRDLLNAQAGATRTGAAKTAAEGATVASDAAARQGLVGAQTNLNRAQTNLLPAQGAADIANTQARTAGLNIANTFAPLQAASGLATQAQGRQITGYTDGPSTMSLGGTGSTAGIPGATDDPANPGIGYEVGGLIPTKKKADESVAQGKGKPGPTDTVPAMLTPGEAVLNKGAVEHYGSDVVAHMNKMGLLRQGAQSEVAKAMGAPDPHAPPQPQGKGGKADTKSGGEKADAKKPASDARKGRPAPKAMPAGGPPTAAHGAAFIHSLFGG